MESLDTSVAVFMDDLLNFSSDIGEEEEEEDDDHHETTNRSLPFSIVPCTNPDAKTLSFPKYAEEELEWISNKDAFPMVESLVDIMLGSSHPSVASTNRLSPISVLENSSSSINSNGSNSKSGSSSGSIMSFSSSLKFPVRARSKPRRKRRRDMLGQQWQWWGQENSKANTKQGAVVTKVSSTMGRKCQHCQAEKTPQWRAGPMGPKTLCNACGVRYKSGRLVPEYRPASSPTFSSLLHSNSHRKVMEMRRKKQLPEMVLKPAEIG